jgi:hypothetical protein
MCTSAPKAPPPPPPPPPPAPPPTPPSASSQALPDNEAYTSAKARRTRNRGVRANLQIPLTSSSGSGVNTQS